MQFSSNVLVKSMNKNYFKIHHLYKILYYIKVLKE